MVRVRKTVPCTVPTVAVPCTHRNRSRSATIFAAIWVHGTGKVGTVHGYGTWVRKTVPMYRTHVPYTHRTHVSCLHRTCTVPAPVPAPKPVPTVPYLSFGVTLVIQRRTLKSRGVVYLSGFLLRFNGPMACHNSCNVQWVIETHSGVNTASRYANTILNLIPRISKIQVLLLAVGCQAEGKLLMRYPCLDPPVKSRGSSLGQRRIQKLRRIHKLGIQKLVVGFRK